MKCKACESSDLIAHISLSRDVSLAARGGGVKVGGVKVSQLDLKDAWELEEGKTRVLRGPILCRACGAEHFYVVGAKDPLFRGRYAEAVELGADSFLEG